MMKRIALGALSVFALAGAASAADMPLKAPLRCAAAGILMDRLLRRRQRRRDQERQQADVSPSGDYLHSLTPAQLAGDTYTYVAHRDGGYRRCELGMQSQYGSIVLGLNSDFNWTGINETHQCQPSC